MFSTCVPAVRPLLSAGVNRRRQLGDIEFSNRYVEFLRSKAKHNSICAFLQRMQGVKKRYFLFSKLLSAGVRLLASCRH